MVSDDDAFFACEITFGVRIADVELLGDCLWELSGWGQFELGKEGGGVRGVIGDGWARFELCLGSFLGPCEWSLVKKPELVGEGWSGDAMSKNDDSRCCWGH